MTHVHSSSTPLLSQTTTSCLLFSLQFVPPPAPSSFLAEWKNRRNQKRTSMNCFHHIYPPVGICIHKPCVSQMNCPNSISGQPLHLYTTFTPPKMILLQQSFPLFPASTFLSTWLFLSAYILAMITPIFIFFSHPKNIIYLSSYSSPATTLYLLSL